MQIYLHQTHHTIANFNEIFSYLEDLSKSPSFQGNIHLFPELFLCGYPLKDLCLQPDFIDNYHQFLKRVKKLFNHCHLQNTALLMGGLKYEEEKIKNIIFEISAEKKLEEIYTKQLLPNYDIFDELKYYTPGKETVIWEFEGLRYALLICQDMWSSAKDKVNPILNIYNKLRQEKLNGIFSFSASPSASPVSFQSFLSL